MKSVYLIVMLNKETNEVEWYCTGRSMTPFSTTNLGAAKTQVTKLWKMYPMRQFSIVTVDAQRGTVMMDFNTLTLNAMELKRGGGSNEVSKEIEDLKEIIFKIKA